MSVLSSRRYLSLWLRRLSTDRIERRLSAPADGPRVIVASIESAQRIVALNDAAIGLGLKTGMALADARARYPSLPVVEADFEADRALLEAIADWCDRYTPLVGLDAPDGLILDITGCAHLFGGEAALARDLAVRLARQGFSARVAVADTVGCAWGVARHDDFNSWQSACAPLPTASRGEGDSRRLSDSRLDAVVLVVPRGQTERTALRLPIAALRVDADIVDTLASLGLRSIADLTTQPRAPLAARFGEQLIRRLDQMLGREDEPITPRLPVPSAMAEQRFPEPIAREVDVLGTVEQLACKLAVVLERRGEGGRLIQLALFRTDGKVHRLEIGTGTPLRDPPRVRKLFQDRLATLGDVCDPGFGYDMVRLSALVTERSDPAQTGLAGGDGAEELAHLIDRLGARFGLRRVSRLIPQNTHIPEYAVMAVPAHAALTFLPRSGGEGRPPQAVGVGGEDASPPHPRPLPTTRSARGRRGDGEAPREEMAFVDVQDSLAPTRPLRLFAKPEPIDAIAQVPDGPPIRFIWHHVTHQVARVEGPERIAMEWWRDDQGNQLTRDYFRVEDSDGVRVWLYREGLYGDEVKLPLVPRWYLQGLFA